MTTSRPSRQTSFEAGLLPTPTVPNGGRGLPKGTTFSGNTALAPSGRKVQVELHHLVEGGGYSPPATPASRSATPGAASERRTPGTSGRSLADSLPDFRTTDRIGAFSRTFVATSAWGSTVCSMTWTTSATPRGRSLYLLRVSARSTAGTGSGSSVVWRTPRAGKTTDEDEAAWTKRQERGDVSTPTLSLAVKMWPTPTVQDGKNDAGPSQWERNSDPLNGDVQRSDPQPGQRLNPDFVSRLMGFPDGWLDLED